MIRTAISLSAFLLVLILAACAGAYMAGDVGPSHAQTDHAHPAGN